MYGTDHGTYAVEDPTHSAVPPTGKNPEIRDIVEKVEPEREEEIRWVQATREQTGVIKGGMFFLAFF